jgi:hypothetical protein
MMLPRAAAQTLSNIAWARTVLQQCHCEFELIIIIMLPIASTPSAPRPSVSLNCRYTCMQHDIFVFLLCFPDLLQIYTVRHRVGADGAAAVPL